MTCSRRRQRPRPISYRVDWHLQRSKSLEAAYQQFQLDWGWN